MGVYSTAAPGGRRGGKPYYFVWQLDNKGFAAQELDAAFMPRGLPRLLAPEELKGRLRFEPGILAAPVSTPDFRQMQQPAPSSDVSDADLAQLQQARRTKQIENDMRASFTKALRALNRPRDRKHALTAIERLAQVTDGIVPAHRHMFRDFGVSLRQKALNELALQCARRALELSPQDDHAHFNMARILGLLGMYDEAGAHLRAAMNIDRTEPIYARMQAWLEREKSLKS